VRVCIFGHPQSITAATKTNVIKTEKQQHTIPHSKYAIFDRFPVGRAHFEKKARLFEKNGGNVWTQIPLFVKPTVP
jgi:hypothetical protein